VRKLLQSIFNSLAPRDFEAEVRSQKQASSSELIALYRYKLHDVTPANIFTQYVDGWSGSREAKLAHAAWILDGLSSEDQERQMISISFVQGVLWSTGVYTMQEMVEQMRKAA
jgi:hypothetical protein